MFSFFHKSIYLADLISGITDFHNHILPGIDDGAKNVDESLQLIKEFKSIGIKDFVATPHIIGEYYPNNPKTISNAYKMLEKHLDSDIKMSYAAEYMMDQHFVDIIKKNEVLAISSNKVLVEMSYFQPPINLNDILFKIQNNSLDPILAHPERYAYWHSKNLNKYAEVISRGCKLQLNMLSLSGHYGQGIQKIAFKLIENNMIEYISSDAHRIDHIEKIKTIKVSKKNMVQLKKIIENSKNLFV